MKAIVLHQPYASLVIAGVKGWETRGNPPNGSMRPEGVRGLPGLGIEPGERVAIVAGAKQPEVGAELGDSGWYWESTAADPAAVVNWRTYGFIPNAPLGAVLGTVEVVEALPMVGEDGDLFDIEPPCIEIRPETATNAGLWAWLDGWNAPVDISDQLPLGDWQPGRWAWRLANPEPLPSPVPCKGKQGVFWIEDPR